MKSIRKQLSKYQQLYGHQQKNSDSAGYCFCIDIYTRVYDLPFQRNWIERGRLAEWKQNVQKIQ